jgi:hypothetical protein
MCIGCMGHPPFATLVAAKLATSTWIPKQTTSGTAWNCRKISQRHVGFWWVVWSERKIFDFVFNVCIIITYCSERCSFYKGVFVVMVYVSCYNPFDDEATHCSFLNLTCIISSGPFGRASIWGTRSRAVLSWRRSGVCRQADCALRFGSARPRGVVYFHARSQRVDQVCARESVRLWLYMNRAVFALLFSRRWHGVDISWNLCLWHLKVKLLSSVNPIYSLSQFPNAPQSSLISHGSFCSYTVSLRVYKTMWVDIWGDLRKGVTVLKVWYPNVKRHTLSTHRICRALIGTCQTSMGLEHVTFRSVRITVIPFKITREKRIFILTSRVTPNLGSRTLFVNCRSILDEINIDVNTHPSALRHHHPSLVETIRVHRLEQGHTFRWMVAWSFNAQIGK